MSDKCKPQNTGIQNYSHSDNAQFDGMCKDNWAPLWCLNRPVIFSGYTKFITDCSKCWAFLQVTILSLIVCKISDVSFYQYAIFYYACCTLSFKKKIIKNLSMQFNLPEKIFQNWINCCIFCRIVKKQIFF